MHEETAERLAELARRVDRQQRRFYARQPQAIGKVLAQVVINQRYACTEANAALEAAWTGAVGQALAARCQPTGIHRGKFEVTVAHSAIAQELSFDTARILQRLRQELPEANLTGVRYRVGVVEDR